MVDKNNHIIYNAGGDAMYFLQLEIDDLDEQYKKVSEKLETMM